MNPDLNVQPTIDAAGILFNQIVNLVIWFFQTYGVAIFWLAIITAVCLLLLSGLKFIGLV